MFTNAGNPSALIPGLKHRHYAWSMFVVTFIILMGASGFRSAPWGMMVPLQEAFGWDRGAISLAISINLIL